GPLAPDPRDQLRRDEAFVEHDGLVVRTVRVTEPDQRAEAQVAVGTDDRLERFLAVVEEVDDRSGAGAQQLDAAEERADVDLVRRLRRRREHWVREEHPRLERQVVPEPAKPVLVRVRVRVHHPGNDGVPRAVDTVQARLADRDDPAVVHDDVGAGEAARADVDQPVPKDDQLRVGSVAVAGASPPPTDVPATSTTASESIVRWSSVCGNASSSRTSTLRASATSPTYRTPAISQHSSGIGPQSCGVS